MPRCPPTREMSAAEEDVAAAAAGPAAGADTHKRPALAPRIKRMMQVQHRACASPRVQQSLTNMCCSHRLTMKWARFQVSRRWSSVRCGREQHAVCAQSLLSVCLPRPPQRRQSHGAVPRHRSKQGCGRRQETGHKDAVSSTLVCSANLLLYFAPCRQYVTHASPH